MMNILLSLRNAIMFNFGEHVLLQERSCIMFVISGADVLLLKDEQDPKCFTRTEEDFTCFFETADNGTYDLLYSFDRYVINSKSILFYILRNL